MKFSTMTIKIFESDLQNPRHREALVNIIDTFAQSPGGQNEPMTEDAKAKLCVGLSAQSNTLVLLGALHGEFVGAAICYWGFSTFTGKPMINIHDLAVLPEFRGRGVGKALMQDVEQRARKSGCNRVTLEVHDSNEGAKRLYASQGFGPWDSPTLFVSKDL